MKKEINIIVEEKKEKGVVGKIIDDLKESTRTVHEINKQNFAKIKQDNRENNPEFTEFVHTKGISNKAKVVVNGIKSSAKKNSAKEAKRRQEIKSHTSYAETLEKSRQNRQTAISKKEEE